MAKKRTDLIDMIQMTLDVHKLYAVNVFPNKKMTTRSVATAFALSEFLKILGINSQVVVESIENLKPGYPATASNFDDKHSLAITVDCKKLCDICSTQYMKSNILIDIYGPTSSKGFGVVNFVDPNVSCSSEIIFREIDAYCKQEGIPFPKSVAQLLYTGLIGGTKRFSANIKENTFDTARQLVALGANYKVANYLYEKKRPLVLKCQEVILNKLQLKENYAIAVIEEEDFLEEMREKATNEDYGLALSSFNNVEDVKVLAMFLRNNDSYNVFLCTNHVHGIDVGYVARKNNGTGVAHFAIAEIKAFDLQKVIDDIESVIEKNAEKRRLGTFTDDDLLTSHKFIDEEEF